MSIDPRPWFSHNIYSLDPYDRVEAVQAHEDKLEELARPEHDRAGNVRTLGSRFPCRGTGLPPISPSPRGPHIPPTREAMDERETQAALYRRAGLVQVIPLNPPTTSGGAGADFPDAA